MVASPEDEIGLILYNTKERRGELEFDNVFVVHEIAPITAERVGEISNYIDTGEFGEMLFDEQIGTFRSGGREEENNDDDKPRVVDGVAHVEQEREDAEKRVRVHVRRRGVYEETGRRRRSRRNDDDNNKHAGEEEDDDDDDEQKKSEENDERSGHRSMRRNGQRGHQI